MSNEKPLRINSVKGAHQILSMAFHKDVRELRDDISDCVGTLCIDKLYYALECNDWETTDIVPLPRKFKEVISELRCLDDIGYIILTDKYIMYLHGEVLEVAVLSCIVHDNYIFDKVLENIIVEEVFVSRRKK